MSIPFYTATEMAQALQWLPLIDHLQQAHTQPAALAKRALLQQTQDNGVENSLLVLPAWQAQGDLGTKIVSVFPANQHLPSIQAIYVLLDGSNGSVKALMDGTELTYWKTAADSALAARYLARQDASRFLMVGAGQLAPYFIRAYLAIRPSLQHIMIWNRTYAKAEKLAQQLQQELNDLALVAPGNRAASKLKIEAVNDLPSAVTQADIVCCATNSYQPLVYGQWLQAGQHLDLVGSYTPEMREVDDEAIVRSNVYVDSRWFTIDCAGDLTQPIAKGVFHADQVRADLFELCSGQKPGRSSATQITLFKSGGGAHLDLMTASFVAQTLRNRAAHESTGPI